MGQRYKMRMSEYKKGNNLFNFFKQIKIKDNGCWEWQSVKNWKGYGRFSIILKNRKDFSTHAHRISYYIFKGNFDKKLHVHHKCENKICVNPKHLELKTNNENRLLGNCWSAINSRKKSCKNGHPFSGKNLYLYYRKYKSKNRKVRACMECRRNACRKTRSKYKLQEQSIWTV